MVFVSGRLFVSTNQDVLTIWKCNAETVYTFIDWNGDFTGAEPPEEYTTTDIEEFQKTTSTPGFSSNGFSRPSPSCWCSPTPSISSGRYLTSPSM